MQFFFKKDRAGPRLHSFSRGSIKQSLTLLFQESECLDWDFSILYPDLKEMIYKQSQIAKVTISAIRKIKHSWAIVLPLFSSPARIPLCLLIEITYLLLLAASE